LVNLNKKVLVIFFLTFTFNLTFFWLSFRGTKLDFFSSDPLELQKLFGGGDRRYYLEAGLDLAAYNKIRDEFFWVYRLWPPGMSILNGLIFKITQANNVITFVHALIASSLLSYFFVNVVQFARIIQMKIASIVFVVAFYLHSFSKNWFFTDLIFYADTIGVLLVLIAFCKILIYLNSSQSILKSLEGGFSIGILICAAALIRSPYIVIIQLISYTYVIAVGIEILKLVSLGIQKYKLRLREINNLVFLSVIVITSTLFSNMWVDFREKNLGIGNDAWTVTQDTAFISPWVPQEKLPDFVRAGGAGWACKIDVTTCADFSLREDMNDRSYSGINVTVEEYKLATVKFVVQNPISYFKDRLQIFQKVWVAEAGLSIEKRERLFESILLFLLLFSFIVHSSVQIKKNYTYILIHVVMFSLIAPYFIFHIEVRYFFALKLISLFGIFVIYKVFKDLKSRRILKNDFSHF
jgi:hypothetical protein